MCLLNIKSKKYWLWCCNWNGPKVAAFSKIYKMIQNDLVAKAITYSFHIGLLCSRPHMHTDHWLGHSPETVRGTDKNWCTLVPRNQDHILQTLQWRVSYFLCYSVRFSYFCLICLHSHMLHNRGLFFQEGKCISQSVGHNWHQGGKSNVLDSLVHGTQQDTLHNTGD